MSELYPIVDLESLAHGAIEPLAFASALLSRRPSRLQLRAKVHSARDAISLLRALVPLAKAAGTCLYVNDSIDWALAAGAPGVHLGQDDMAIEDARRLAPHLRFGLSTHTVVQLQRAVAHAPDYVAFGPIFTTLTKLDAAPAVGIDGLIAAKKHVGCTHLVAIGGIDERALGAVSAVADSVALISALIAPAPLARYDALSGILRREGTRT